MAFDRTKAFEVDNGVATDGGAGLFWAQNVPPVSGNEVQGDRLTDSNGRRWRFDAGVWIVDVDFSVNKINAGETYEVRPHEQLSLFDGPLVNLGQLNNLGQVSLLKVFQEAPEVVFPVVTLPPDNFSYFKIAAGESKEVPANQQMNTFGSLQNLGMLKVLGEVNLTKIFQDDPEDEIELPGDNFSHFDILAGETKTVPTRQQMTVVGPFRNLGQIKVFGSMALISGAEPVFDDDYLPPWKIEVDQVFVVKSNRVLQVPRSFVNLGQLTNNGFVYLGG